MFYKVENYTDKEGRNIRVLTEAKSKGKEFFGSAVIKSPQDPSGGGFPVNFKFPQEADTIERCFELFDSVLSTALEEGMKQAEEQKQEEAKEEKDDNLIVFPGDQKKGQ